LPLNAYQEDEADRSKVSSLAQFHRQARQIADLGEDFPLMGGKLRSWLDAGGHCS
jgi:hypothetical protein